MPCPFFEPQAVVSSPQHPNARLPLLDEYEGTCHAAGDVFPVPFDLRFRCCNHGYSRGSCNRFPLTETRSSVRFNITRATSDFLELLYVEERDYAPLRWHSLCYSVQTEVLEPELSDSCARAQVLAFCRSYRRRFPDAGR